MAHLHLPIVTKPIQTSELAGVAAQGPAFEAKPCERPLSSGPPCHQYCPKHIQTGGIAMSILELYCSVDEFWQHFALAWERDLLASGTRRRRRATQLHPSEIMTIAILFQQSHYRTFKAFYCALPAPRAHDHSRGSRRSFCPVAVAYALLSLWPSVVRVDASPFHLASECASESQASSLGPHPRSHSASRLSNQSSADCLLRLGGGVLPGSDQERHGDRRQPEGMTPSG
jgi:hypothetical protein